MTFERVALDTKLRRSVDPGQTYRLRKAFSSAVDLQLRQLRAGLRKAIVDFNVLGLSGPSNFTFMSPAARLNQFAGWLETAANASLDARWWVHPWIDKATQHGLMMAKSELRGGEYQPIPTTFESLHQMAHDELRGIIGTLVQKVMRTAHSTIARQLVPHQAFRELVKPIDGDIHHRLQLFTQYMTVKSHVHGKVAYYRQAGITHVGISPELRLLRPIRHDYSVHDSNVAEVGWQTAEDNDVCDDCEEMAQGSPYTLDEIMDLIPLHANCRCEPVMWGEGDYSDSMTFDAGNPDVEFIRDPTSGRFAGSIGHSMPSQPHDPGLSHHYSSKAVLRGGIIYTPNVYDATRALYEGRNVVLKQPKQMSTLVKHLGQVSARMVEMGSKAPNFDLCKVTIKGTNLFCADTHGIPRIEMPQMSKLQTRIFINNLIEKGYRVEYGKEKASNLRATQNQLVGAKVADNVRKMKAEPERMNRRIVISKDDYILDGHHKWAAMLAIDARNNKIGDLKMRVARVDIDILTLLKLAKQFTRGKGAKTGDAFDPDEERDFHGRWTSSGGGESGGTIAFHGTTEEVAQNIIKEGIKISPGGRSFGNELYSGPRGQSVYVADNLTRALDWAQRRSDTAAFQHEGNEPHSLVVFKLNIPKDEWAKFKEDEVAVFGAARGEMNIPPSWIVKATGYDAFDIDGENPHDIPLHDALNNADHVIKYMVILVAHEKHIGNKE